MSNKIVDKCCKGCDKEFTVTYRVTIHGESFPELEDAALYTIETPTSEVCPHCKRNWVEDLIDEAVSYEESKNDNYFVA